MLSSRDGALLEACVLVRPQGDEPPGLLAGRNNGNPVVQFHSTDSLLQGPEYNSLVPTGWASSRDHYNDTASQQSMTDFHDPPLLDL